MARFKRESKYHARKCTLPTGETFDSVKERDRYLELCLLQKAGQIEELKRQVRFRLIPGQDDERPVDYYADFMYTDCRTGETVVEDVKGFKTPEYIIKRKLMKYLLHIKVVEIK
ncbi:MAG: DUF1064 domain-containing protein [Clostridia bacterium]|nr:DUF1064 domain-containing protein [Clostridia bacterium]